MKLNATKTIVSFKEKNDSKIYKVEFKDTATREYIEYRTGFLWLGEKKRKYYDIEINHSIYKAQNFLDNNNNNRLIKIENEEKIIIWNNVDLTSITVTQEDIEIEVIDSIYYEDYGGAF